MRRWVIEYLDRHPRPPLWVQLALFALGYWAFVLLSDLFR